MTKKGFGVQFGTEGAYYDRKFGLGSHVEDLHDEGGPTDGATIDDRTGRLWTDKPETEADELLALGGHQVDVFGLEGIDDDNTDSAQSREVVDPPMTLTKAKRLEKAGSLAGMGSDDLERLASSLLQTDDGISSPEEDSDVA